MKWLHYNLILLNPEFQKSQLKNIDIKAVKSFLIIEQQIRSNLLFYIRSYIYLLIAGIY
ncbi:hypothetical protein GA0061073_1065 [Lactobacillus apis]|nr:hypothetical protein GCM10007323_10160 [Lactobacillus apis]SCB94040.1 hypothetical protein GA0061073_1065 [Lactobacillus apis]